MDTHKVVGTGATIEAANRSLGSSRGDLTKKFEAAGVSTKVKVERTVYTANLTLNGKCTANVCTRHIEIESEKGWEAVTDRAVASAGGRKHLGRYDSHYTVAEYLELTDTQRRALEPRSTPAGYTDSPDSGMRDTLRL